MKNIRDTTEKSGSPVSKSLDYIRKSSTRTKTIIFFVVAAALAVLVGWLL